MPIHTKNFHYPLLITAILTMGCQHSPQIESAKQTVQTESSFQFMSTASDNSDHVLKKIEPIAQYSIDSNYDNGLIIAAVTPDGVSIKAFGTLANLPDPAHTRLQIGSLSKVFVGMQLASMVLDGTVSIDTPLAQCLPANIQNDAIKDITLGMLTTHTSGLPRLPKDMYANSNPNDPYTHVTVDLLWNMLASTEINGQGTFQYSNFGASVLGHALAQCAHADSWESLLATRVTNVLKLSSISIEDDESMPQGYDMSMASHSPWTWNNRGMAPAGALKANILDLSRLIQMSISNDNFPGKDMILKSQEIIYPGDESNNMPVGMNWMHNVGTLKGIIMPNIMPLMENVIWHDGQTGTFSSYLGFIPEKQAGVVILSDTSSGTPSVLGTLSLAQVAGDSPETAQKVLQKLYPPEVSLPIDKLKRFEGDLLLEDANETFSIRLDEDGKLWDTSHQLRLWPDSDSSLRYRVVNMSIKFEFNDDNSIKSITYIENGQPLPMKKL